MKGFQRNDQLFSLCGLNCGLCPMRLDGYCPGCGGGAGNQSCKLARCSLERGGVEYCFQCGAYPCGHYAHIDDYDSFITHRRRRADMERAERLGMERYHAEQRERAALLALLLRDYNDGRKKTLFCVAANLLELDALRAVLEQLELRREALTLRERGRLAAELLQEAAGEVELKLRRKPKR